MQLGLFNPICGGQVSFLDPTGPQMLEDPIDAVGLFAQTSRKPSLASERK